MAQETGSIVAFEGAQDTILTQLRLLPTSPQILILPSVQSYLSSNVLDQDEFDPTLLIKKTHEAAKARRETAAQFLQASSPTNKRLVFLNGGTPSAQALCIREIMKNITRGDAVAAEAIFNDLTRDGLAGLEAKGHEYRRRHHIGYSDPGSYDEAGQDPITKAMKAADALDRLTASLQTSNDLDLTNNRVSRFPRRSSLPLYGYSDSFCDAAPFFVFGNRQEAAEERVRQHFSTAVPNFHLSIPGPQKQPSRLTFGDQSQFLSTHLDTSNDSGIATPVSIAPSTACSEYLDTRDGDVEFGEAAILEMRSPVRKSSLKRVRSLDRMFPSSPQYRDPCFALELCGIDVNASKRFSAGSLTGSFSDSTSRPESIGAPRTITIGPKRPAVVTISPVPLEKKKKKSPSTYVDHATDTDDITLQHAAEAVLSTTENLVVYFKDDIPDMILDNVISHIKDDSQCPLITSSASSTSNLDLDSLPQTPDSPDMHVSESKTTSRHWRERSVFSDDYDPYSYTQHQMPWYPGPEAQVTVAVQAANLPTPQHSPRPSVSGEAAGVHVFHVTREQSAIAVQNSLRSILGGYFPAEARGYHQFQFAVLPEIEGLWKPIFRDAETNGNPQKNKRRMDLIMAVGSQRGVSKDFSSEVTGKLERLGVKRSGQTRSGRLDFRYLIANAMQAFTAQPLANQSCDNPFANPYLLATLLVPRLETYLAAHPAIRFLLLEFPPEHLATVLALQKLVGLDLMKVAQVLDSSKENTGPFTHIRGASIASQAEKPKAMAEAEKPSPIPTCESDVSVSKANFLLMSTASKAEVDTFVSTVQAILEKLSSFYKTQEPQSKSCQVTQDLDLKPLPPIQRQNLPTLQSNFSPYARRPSPELPLSAVMLQPPQLDSPTSVSTFSDTVPTPRSARSRFARHWKSEQIPVHAFDEDSDYDIDERRLLPMFLQKPPKGNSRKALKFLGLA
jgi:hypothetical protein